MKKIVRDIVSNDGSPPNWSATNHMFISDQHGMSTGVRVWSISFGNDAGDIHIWRRFEDDEKGRYVLMLSASDFRKLALWYLWRWIIGEWFGFRRWLYFKWLKYEVNRLKKS